MLGKSLYLFASNILGYGIRIILPMFLVRLLTKEEFGAYSQFFLLEILIKTIFQMGIAQSLYFFVPRDRDNAGAYLLNSLMLNVATYSVAYALAWVFKDTVAAQTGMQIIYTYFWHLATYSLLMMLNVSVISYLTALQNVRAASILTVLREVLASIGTLFAAFVYRDLHPIILALVISRALSLLIGILYVQLALKGFRAEKYFFGIGAQVKYGLVLGLGGTIWIYAIRFHELLVSRNFDITTYAVYAAGCKQIPFLQFYSQAIASVALGQFAMLVKNQDWDGVQELWNKILATMYGVGLPVVAILLLVSKPLVITMFTADYAGAVPIFRFSTLATMGMIINPTLVLRAIDRNDISLKINAALFVILPFAIYGGMKLWGLLGIIAVNMLYVVGSPFVTQTFLNRLVPVHLSYVAPLGSIWEFYGESLAKGRDLLVRFFTRPDRG